MTVAEAGAKHVRPGRPANLGSLGQGLERHRRRTAVLARSHGDLVLAGDLGVALDQPSGVALHLVESLQAARLRQALVQFAPVALKALPLPVRHAVGDPPAGVADDIQARFPHRLAPGR